MQSRCSMVGVALLVGAAAVVSVAWLAGCYCVPSLPEPDPNTGQVSISDDPLSDDIADDANLPYDRAAVIAALEELDLVEPNLAGYKFALLFIFQNQFDSDIAFDVYVNFQKVEPRRLVQAGRQEIVPITNDVVEQTEVALRAEGVASGNAALASLLDTRDIYGRPCPYIVQFINFVTTDDHIITDQSLLLTPLNAPGPDGTQLEPLTKDSPPLKLPPVYECPAIIAFVIEKTRMRGIELDRELTVPDYDFDPQEPADPTEPLFPYAVDIVWLAQQVTVMTHYSREILLVPS